MDFSPLLENLGTLLLSGVGAAIVWLARNFLKGYFDDTTRNAIYAAIEAAIGYGKAEAMKQLGNVGTDVEIKNLTLRIAVQYVMTTVPGLLDHFGIGTEEEVEKRVVARLEKYFAENA